MAGGLGVKGNNGVNRVCGRINIGRVCLLNARFVVAHLVHG